jgi:serine/threonine protein kinase
VLALCLLDSPKKVFLATEFLPDGELMNLLIDGGSQKLTRFPSSGKHDGFIHRDIKPDNPLQTRTSHIRQTDSGLSAKLDGNSDRLTQLIA